jgi:hypothetical protein
MMMENARMLGLGAEIQAQHTGFEEPRGRQHVRSCSATDTSAAKPINVEES